MSVFPGGEIPLAHEGHEPHVSKTDIYAHVEGLCCEEDALLAVPDHERTPHQHERLHEIGEELNRVWSRLSERAHALGHHQDP